MGTHVQLRWMPDYRRDTHLWYRILRMRKKMRESRKFKSLSRITIVMQISSSIDDDSKEMRKFGTGCDYVVTSTFLGGCEDSSFLSLTFSAIAPLEFPLCVFQFYYYSWGATEAEDIWPWQSQSSHTYSWEWFCFLLRRTKVVGQEDHPNQTMLSVEFHQRHPLSRPKCPLLVAMLWFFHYGVISVFRTEKL